MRRNEYEAINTDNIQSINILVYKDARKRAALHVQGDSTGLLLLPSSIVQGH